MGNGSKTTYAAAQIINALFGGQPLVVPGTWYLAGSLLPYTDAADGSALNEPVGNGYFRTPIVNDLTNWPLSNPGELKIAAIEIATPAASGGDWGDLQSAYLCDDPVAGNAWFGGNLLDIENNPTRLTIIDGGLLAFLAGNFIIDED